MPQNDIDRRPLVNLRVNKSQKERWSNEASERDRYSSLSDLIRKSVEKELNGEHESTFDPAEVQALIADEYESILEELERVSTDVARLHTAEEESLDDFAHRLHKVLEPVPTDDREALEATIGVSAGLDPQTPTELATLLNSTPRRVKDAIELLKEWDMPLVEFVDEEDGSSHWFKEKNR